MKRFHLLAILSFLLLILSACISPFTKSAQKGQGMTPDLRSLSPYLLAEAEYPEAVPFPNLKDYEFDYDAYDEAFNNWSADRKKNLMEEKDIRKLDEFFTAVIPTFLSENEQENVLCSPINLYFALSMLAEVTESESRAQVMDLLAASDLDTLRQQTLSLWNSAYRNDKVVTTLLANSFWLSENHTYKEETLKNLAAYHKASSFSGSMGSEVYNEALHTWLNEQTGGLLKDKVAGQNFRSDTVLALVSAIYYSGAWGTPFQKDLTAPATFYAPNGEITCDFMKNIDTGVYYQGNDFSAVSLDVDQGGKMLILLPKETATPEDLLQNPETMDFLFHYPSWDSAQYGEIHLALPKFDISSQLSLEDGLKKLGVTDVFDAGVADFSPLMDLTGLAVSEATHCARVKIEEEGCEGAAYTFLAIPESAPITENISFTVDRPFLFCITSDQGLPLFAGIVNHPT